MAASSSYQRQWRKRPNDSVAASAWQRRMPASGENIEKSVWQRQQNGVNKNQRRSVRQAINGVKK